MDCASGVGFAKMKALALRLSNFFNLTLVNDQVCFSLIDRSKHLPYSWKFFVLQKGGLNERCGAHYVRTNKIFPRNFENLCEGQRCVSIDGDADCLVYFYCTKEEGFVVLDGDKIGVLSKPSQFCHFAFSRFKPLNNISAHVNSCGSHQETSGGVRD
jgi:hypothetical protein